MHKNEIHLTLSIWNFDDIGHDQLTELIGLQPTKVHIKGERINPKFQTLAKDNGWLLSCSLGKYAPFEEQLEYFLDILEQKIDVFEELSGRYYFELSCALYVYVNNEESTPWVHLNARYNEVIKRVKMEFDIDLYCLDANDQS